MSVKSDSVQSKEVTVPFVYGSIAFPLSKKLGEYTHKWICYLRGVDGQNLSWLINKVIFHLHPSCGNPVREVNSFPFQIQQQGWGEFQIQLDVYLTLPKYPVIHLVHQLKLHHNHLSGSQVSKKPLCSEAYDEFVFPVPDQQLLEMVAKRQQNLKPSSQIDQELPPEHQDTFTPDVPLNTVTSYSRYFMKFDANDHRVRLEDAIKFINSQIGQLKKQMTQVDMEVNKLFEELSNNRSG